jgi:hypothetical protein
MQVDPMQLHPPKTSLTLDSRAYSHNVFEYQANKSQKVWRDRLIGPSQNKRKQVTPFERIMVAQEL